MLNRPIKEVNAEFMAEEKYLDSIQRTVRESCISASMNKKDITTVMLAIEEAATNVMRHAYLYEKGIIRLRIVIYKKLIVFSIIDNGRSFQPKDSTKIDLQKLVDSGRKGGLGFYMIQKIMDSVEYISTAGFNELRMIKRLSPQSSSAAPMYLRRMFSLRVKFSLYTFIIMSIIIGASIYYFDYKTSEQMYDHKHETVLALGNTIAAQASGYFINRRSDVEFDQLTVSYKRANPEIKLIVLTDENNLIRAHSDDILNIRKPYNPRAGIDTSILNRPQQFTEQKELFNYVIVPIKTENHQWGKVHLIYSTATIYEKLTQSRESILYLTLVLIAIGIVGIYLLSDYFVKPILKITHRVRSFTSGDMDTELPLEGAEEFFEISRAFNEMITRLSQDRRNIIEREKMAKEIEVAGEIQKTLLPEKLPDIPDLQIDAFYKAASIIGGDLYDIFRIEPNTYCMAVADVSGKGVPASLVMSMLRTIIRIYAVDSLTPKETLVKVNSYLKDNIPPGMFVTIFLIFYNIENESIEFVSAGHNPMIYYDARHKKIEKINPRGMPMGMPIKDVSSFERTMEERSIKLNPEDSFMIYTDGITEAANRDNELFGMERLEQFYLNYFKDKPSNELSHLSNLLIAELEDFAGFVKPADDITFIVAQFKAAVKKPDKPTDSSVSIDTTNIQNLESD